MSIRELIEKLPEDEAFFSFEFFPPKTRSGTDNLISRISRLSKLGPLFVNVTWGAGGSTAEKSLELAKTFQSLGLVTCLHLTCTNMDKAVLDDALSKAKSAGIRNILALRGDRPREEQGWHEGADEFVHAVDLIRYIKQRYGDYFCIGVAAYPEGHSDGFDEEQDPAKDLPFLIEKIKAGGEFIITQLFYDTDKFIQFEKLIRDEPSGVLKGVPIIPGLMPINTYQSFLRASKLSHASIPDSIVNDIDAKVPINDDEAIKQYGVNLLSGMISKIRESTGNKVRGFHFYTLNLEKSVALVLDKANLVKVSPLSNTSSAAGTTASNTAANAASGAGESAFDSDNELSHEEVAKLRKDTGAAVNGRRRSSLAAHNRVVVSDDDRANEDENVSVSQTTAARTFGHLDDTSTVLSISTGEGSLGREATWDDFPNGRFGDSRSPAFGEIDGYGPTLHVDKATALKLWGYPVDKADINKIFVRHMTNELEVVPFSDQGFSPETAIIQEELIELNRRGYWTVASQPAGNCISSSDNVFGWGPSNGKIFQKAFVEMFISPEDWAKLKPRLDALGDDEISYFNATANPKSFVSKLPEGATSNAVTWGVFPNREIVQSTIIEKESFLAWRDESFGIWAEWEKLYPTKSASAQLLKTIHDTFHLVSIVHHNYFDEQALWNVLLEK